MSAKSKLMTFALISSAKSICRIDTQNKNWMFVMRICSFSTKLGVCNFLVLRTKLLSPEDAIKNLKINLTLIIQQNK